MKILQCIYQFKTGGGALQVVTDLACAARGGGHRVTVLSRDVPVSLDVGAERFFTGNKLLDWWRLGQRLRRERYDIVHVHDRYCSLLVSLLPGAPPSVQTNHVAYRTRRRLTRFADCVVGCSRSMDRHHAEYFGLPSERRALIPNGVFVRPPGPEATALRDQLPMEARHRRLCLTVARLNPQKGHAHLLRAIQRLAPEVRRDWCFVWCGSGELENDLRHQAQALGVADNLYFAGHSRAVAEWLSLAEAFVLPSLYEGLPLALLEAMAAGLPCLATAVDGNLEVLSHSHNGLLCASGDANDLCCALGILLADEALRQRLGAQARADYQRSWTFERTWEQYEALYRSLLRPEPATNPIHATFIR